MKNRYRFVIDTNVLVSALLTPGGTSRQVTTKANRNGFILQSNETFEEVERVIHRPRFDPYIADEERARFLLDLATKSIFIPITERISACGDPDDDKFLELAVSGRADIIITGNTKDFPPSPFRGIRIVKPAEFSDLDLSELTRGREGAST